jgi:hypothetical protein
MHTAAGQMLVIAISLRPSRTKSIANPLVKTLIATLPRDWQHDPVSGCYTATSAGFHRTTEGDYAKIIFSYPLHRQSFP